MLVSAWEIKEGSEMTAWRGLKMLVHHRGESEPSRGNLGEFCSKSLAVTFAEYKQFLGMLAALRKDPGIPAEPQGRDCH